MKALDVARGRRFVDWPNSLEAEPFTAADLDARAVGRLLERAARRVTRVAAAERHGGRDLFWLRAELALALAAPRVHPNSTPYVHPNVVRRWRRTVSWRARDAEWSLEHWRRLEALVLQHEPETDAWLRRQLSELEEPRPASRTESES